MKLLVIYGSPGVGKLTTAREVARLTGFRLFHNHLTISAVAPVFDFGTAPFWKLVHRFRIETIAEAARENIDLIYTFCYAKGSDDAHIDEVAAAVRDNGGDVRFVLLRAEKAIIEARAADSSREALGKLCDVATLRELWTKHELFSPVNGYESLTIDNTHLSAEQTARQIVAHLVLPAV